MPLQLLAKEESHFPFYRIGTKGLATIRQFQTFENTTATTPIWKREADLAEVELKAEIELSSVSELEFEIEIEHGGTGSALEFEPFEEFGEFEHEPEQGGEVVLEEIYYLRNLWSNSWVKAGKIPVMLSLRPHSESYFDYPGLVHSSAEARMLPKNWNEVGVEYGVLLGSFRMRSSLTTGLNSEFFRKYSWVGGGYQRRFEHINANDLAVTLSLEWGNISTDHGFGFSIYRGNTAGNRHKLNKLSGEAHLTIGSLLGAWRWEDLRVRGQVLYGALQNSDKISLANTTLTASANPGAFASLGHIARLEMIEVLYDWINQEEKSFTPFVRIEHVDTMAQVEGSILRDDRQNQMFFSTGFTYRFDDSFFVKTEYTKSSNALNGSPATDAYALGAGFDIEKLGF